MKQLRIIGPVLVVSALVGVGWWLMAGQEVAVFSPTGVISEQQRSILIFTLALSALVVIPVFIMLFLFAWKFRESNTKAKYRPEWDKNNKLEMLWWGIPIAIISVLGVVAVQTSHSLDPYKKIASDKSTLEVQVVAMEWKWLFLYPELGVASVNLLPMPVDRPVRFTLTADAPMSAFWIPKLGSQIYAMNGMSSQLNLMANELGDYRGYNTNINGEGYAHMTFTARAVTQADFDSWVEKTSASPDKMDSAAYEKLAVPSTVEQPKSYQLVDTALYDTILMKYMGHEHDNQRESEPVELAPDPMPSNGQHNHMNRETE